MAKVSYSVRSQGRRKGFWEAGHVLFLALGVSYMGVSVCENNKLCAYIQYLLKVESILNSNKILSSQPIGMGCSDREAE